jgi:hypothetical protein
MRHKVWLSILPMMIAVTVAAQGQPLVVPAFLAASSRASGRSAGSQPRRDYSTLNVCQIVPGESIARALNGRLAEARAFSEKTFSRCTYFVFPPGTEQRLGYVVWMQPPEDFEELKKHVGEPLTALTGLGDGAYMFRDTGDGRFKINVLKRNDVMFQATGDSAASARKVADAVATTLWKTAR